MGTTIKELLLYRYRYVLGYLLLAVLSIGLAAWQLGDIPPGFSALERQSAVISEQLSTASSSFVNLPYHLLQKGTLELFGPTALGIRLPSVIFALLVGLGAYFLLRRWFGENIAVVGTILVVTSAHFLARGRVGSPLILYSLWPTLLLLTASFANFQGKRWRLWVWLFAIVAALALYTPYIGLLVVILAVAVIASRQGRGLVSEIGSPVAMLSLVVFCALLVPLGWGVYNNPESLFAYLGFVDAPSLSLVLERLKEMTQTLVDVQLERDRLFSPVLSIPAFLLGLYGLWYSFTSAARSRYAIIILWLLTSIAIFLSAESAPISLLFAPISLLVIIGLHRFIRQWYEIFPRNPYARIVALVPIALLLFVVVQFNYSRYFYGIPRSDNVRVLYNQDILLLTEQLNKNSSLQNATIVVPEEEKEFYGLLSKRFADIAIIEAPTSSRSGGPLIVSEELYRTMAPGQQAQLATRSLSLIVDSRPDNQALRFRVYQ